MIEIIWECKDFENLGTPKRFLIVLFLTEVFLANTVRGNVLIIMLLPWQIPIRNPCSHQV